MYYCGAAMESPNIPPNPLGEGAFSLLVESTYTAGVSQTLTWYVSGKTHKRLCTNTNDDEWTDWGALATATPPQVFDLPLSDGWTEHRASEYFKTQENIVTVYFQVHTSSPQGGEVTLATLPEGFRPPNTIGGSGYCGIIGEKYAPADVKVYPNGDITGFNDVGAAEYYTGFFTFVTAS